MFASFFSSSNNWFGYIANFFFAAAGFGSIARWVYKVIIKHNDDKMHELEKEIKLQKADQDAKFEQLLSQYRPNGGSSSKDQWNKIERIVEDLKNGQDVLHERIDGIKQDFAEHKGYHKGLTDREV